MAIPSIAQSDGAVGFHWRDTAGRPAWLVDLFAVEGAEPSTHTTMTITTPTPTSPQRDRR